MKSVLIVITLLVSTAYVESKSNSELLDQLHDLFVEASQRHNQAALDLVNDAISTVNMALVQMTSAKDQATKDLFQSHIDFVQDDLSKLEKMVKQEIKTRGFMSRMHGAFNYASSKAALLTGKVHSIFSHATKSGFGGLVALFEPFFEKVINNPNIKQMIGGLETITSALEQLNKMTGGMFQPLNAVTDILSNIEASGKLFEEMSAANSSDAIADAMINTLASAKSSHAHRIEKALDYVCNGLEDAEQSL
uniref:Secreted 84 isoform X1 n=1 Tax=Tetranychus evansi TaxID=178897 RepID=A0A3G5AP95_9ACAR|nr:secreted 84 isoform X1 [Tetranychus evansi]